GSRPVRRPAPEHSRTPDGVQRKSASTRVNALLPVHRRSGIVPVLSLIRSRVCSASFHAALRPGKRARRIIMVAVKAADVDAFVARPDPARRVVLVFGPDAGLVGERVRTLLAASVDDINDPFALARLDGEEPAAEPAGVAEEALTRPLFGGRRAVWVKAGSRNIAPAVEALLGDALFAASPTCRVVIEAGDLRRNAPLRVVCERAKNAAALPCYA